MEAVNIKAIQLDLKKTKLTTIGDFIQNDTNIIKFTLTDNGSAIDLDVIDQILINYKKPSGEVISRVVTAEADVITYQLGFAEMSEAGLGKLVIQFFKSGNRISTFTVDVNIKKSIEGNFAFEETEKGLVDQMFEQINSFDERLENLVIEGGGVPLSSSLTSTSESTAATSKAVKSLSDLIGTKAEKSYVDNLIGQIQEGSDGKSAFEVAVQEGFNGTESQWLASLKGQNGTIGKSAYQVWLDLGNSGTEQDFINSLRAVNNDLLMRIEALEDAINNGTIPPTPTDPPGNSVPNEITNLSYSNLYSNTVTVSWNTSLNATFYDVFQNGTLIISTRNTNFIVRDLVEKTAYTFTVKARNTEGSTPGKSVTITTPENNGLQKQAVFSSGASRYIDAGTHAAFDLSDGVESYELRLKLQFDTIPTSGWVSLLGKDHYNGDLGYILYYDGTTGTLNFVKGGEDFIPLSFPFIFATNLHYDIKIIGDGVNTKVLINDKEFGTTTYTTFPAATETSLKVGARNGNYGYGVTSEFNGKISYFSIKVNGVAQAIYDMQTGTVQDQSGNNRHAAFNGLYEEIAVNYTLQPTSPGFVSFIDDDGRLGIYDVLFPLFESRNSKLTVAISPELIDNPPSEAVYGAATWDQLREIQSAGHEIVSHSLLHESHGSMTPSVETQNFVETKERLITEGFSPVNSYVYPFGITTDFSKTEAPKHYEVAFTTNKGIIDLPVTKSRAGHLPRYGIGAFGGLSTKEIKQACLDAFVTGKWVTIMSHIDHVQNQSPTNWNRETNTIAIREVLDHCLFYGINVVPVSEAIERSGEIVDDTI